jgi:hypothetical protein
MIDQGGMLDDSGRYKKQYSDLLELFTDTGDDHCLAVLHHRAPFVDDLRNRELVLHQRVKSLEINESMLLLQQLCKKMGLEIKSKELHEIAEYLDGYPPAVYFTARHIDVYGLAPTLADKSLLTEFKAKSFTRFVSDLKLSDKEWLILRYLASEQFVPLSAIVIVVQLNAEDAVPLLRNLIDHSLVVVVDENFSVSPPIRAAVFQVKGYLNKDTYNRLRLDFMQMLHRQLKSLMQLFMQSHEADLLNLIPIAT